MIKSKVMTKSKFKKGVNSIRAGMFMKKASEPEAEKNTMNES